MSIYTECGEAARKLLDDPSLRQEREDAPQGVFTEMDVILLSSASAGGYSEDELRLAMREASQVMGALFRTRLAARFGPVSVPGFADPDYVRIDTKIAYASPEGPAEIETPNGVFGRILVHDDDIVKPGRRFGTNRTDMKSWNEQDIAGDGTVRVPRNESQEILRLRAENAALKERARELEERIENIGSRVVEVLDTTDIRHWFESLQEETIERTITLMLNKEHSSLKLKEPEKRPARQKANA